MKKTLYLKIIIVSFILCFAFSVSAAILPPNSRAFTGKIINVHKDKMKKNFIIKVRKKRESLVFYVPQSDPLKLMTTINSNRGKIVTVIYSFPEMTILNLKTSKRKKPKQY